MSMRYVLLFFIGTYCCLEVDNYGKFDRKARTPVANAIMMSQHGIKLMN